MRGQINYLKTYTELLKFDNRALAITDNIQKIIWYNKKFKNDCGFKKNKGNCSIRSG